MCLICLVAGINNGDPPDPLPVILKTTKPKYSISKNYHKPPIIASFKPCLKIKAKTFSAKF